MELAGDEIKEEVIVPVRRPRQKDEQNTHLKADQYVNDNGDFCGHVREGYHIWSGDLSPLFIRRNPFKRKPATSPAL